MWHIRNRAVHASEIEIAPFSSDDLHLFNLPNFVVSVTKNVTTAVSKVISLVPRRSEGRGERTPGTHCLRMRLISEISRKIGYFSNPPCNDDV